MVLRASLVIAAEDAHAFAEPWQRARWLCHCELSFGCCAGQRRERVRCYPRLDFCQCRSARCFDTSCCWRCRCCSGFRCWLGLEP
jgi:hypothetical protein